MVADIHEAFTKEIASIVGKLIDQTIHLSLSLSLSFLIVRPAFLLIYRAACTTSATVQKKEEERKERNRER